MSVSTLLKVWLILPQQVTDGVTNSKPKHGACKKLREKGLTIWKSTERGAAFLASAPEHRLHREHKNVVAIIIILSLLLSNLIPFQKCIIVNTSHLYLKVKVLALCIFQNFWVDTNLIYYYYRYFIQKANRGPKIKLHAYLQSKALQIQITLKYCTQNKFRYQNTNYETH